MKISNSNFEWCFDSFISHEQFIKMSIKSIIADFWQCVIVCPSLEAVIKLHKACLFQSIFVLVVFMIHKSCVSQENTDRFSTWFCFLFRTINVVHRIHTWLATQTDWNLSWYPRGTTSCHTVRSYTSAVITWLKVNLL